MLKEENDSFVHITASSGTTACHGFYHYLKYYCGCQVAWEGSQISLPEEFPAVDIHVQAPSKIVYFQNVCTFSYSYAWWTMDQWRRHIDWIALHGITMTLAPFQEDIWTQLYHSFGIHREEIDDHFAGPAFLAWNRMVNKIIFVIFLILCPSLFFRETCVVGVVHSVETLKTFPQTYKRK